MFVVSGEQVVAVFSHPIPWTVNFLPHCVLQGDSRTVKDFYVYKPCTPDQDVSQNATYSRECVITCLLI